MPRGKNYVNQNTGMKLKGKDQVKELCFYGNACERKGCIYRHDRKSTIIEGNQPKSTEPCMAYLAGLCSFTDTTCRKYHPPTDDEINILLQKYQRIPCRFTIHCKTKGCLYMHPDPTTGTYPMINTIPLPPHLLLLNQYNNNNNNNNNNNRNVEPNLLDPNLFPPLQSNNNKDGSVDVTQQQQQQQQNNLVVSSSTSTLSIPQQQQYQQFPQQPRQLYQQQSHMTTVIPNHNNNDIMQSQQQLLNNRTNNYHNNDNNNQYDDDVTPYCTFVPTASLKNATGSLIPTAPIQYRKQVQGQQVPQVSKQLQQPQHDFNHNNNNNESLNIQAKEFLPSNYTNSSRS